MYPSSLTSDKETNNYQKATLFVKWLAIQKKICNFAASCSLMAVSCAQQVETKKSELTTVGNPYMPLWEHIPDGEPYVFEDPDNPGKQRVYVYGSHDNLKTMYCGRDQVVCSTPVVF